MRNTIILIATIFAFILNSCNSDKKKQDLSIKENNKDILVKNDNNKNTKNLIGTWNWRSDIANQLIGQNPDGEAPEDVHVSDKTFVINKDLSISVFDKIYKRKMNF